MVALSESRKEWLRTYGAFVAITVAVLSFFASNATSERQELVDQAVRNQIRSLCADLNEGRQQLNERLVHLTVLTETVQQFSKRAAEARHHAAALATTPQERHLNKAAAREYLTYADDIARTEDLLVPFDLLDCSL